MRKVGKVIQTYLVDGIPSGMRMIEIWNWTGIALTAFKGNLSDFLERKELSNPSVYFLIGDDEESVYHKRIYIGEAENFKDRLRGHMDKEFWNQCIVFTSKDDHFNKAHVKWLESHFYSDFSKFGYVSLENGNAPKKPKLSESVESYLREYGSNVYLVLGALGVYIPNIKEDNVKKMIKQRFHMTEAGVDAHMEREQGLYKVLKGSIIHKERPKYRERRKNAYEVRDSLLNDKFLVEQDNGTLLLKKDVYFKSPSAASVFCAGINSNGRKAWKIGKKTLADFEEEEIQ